MERLSSIIKKYNIGAETIIDFLQVNGFVGQLNLATKLDSKFIELIEKEFNSDKEDKIIANSRKLPETESDKIYNAIKAIGVNQTKRISIDPGNKLTYRDIFGQCFWGCSEINCIDPYIREKHQFENLGQLIFMMREFSINPINFNLTTCYDPKNTRSKKLIEINLEQFRKTHFSINFNFSLEEDKYYHDRYINVDNKYLIDLTRGLDIFENYNNPYNTITKKCTVFITRIK